MIRFAKWTIVGLLCLLGSQTEAKIAYRETKDRMTDEIYRTLYLPDTQQTAELRIKCNISKKEGYVYINQISYLGLQFNLSTVKTRIGNDDHKISYFMNGTDGNAFLLFYESSFSEYEAKNQYTRFRNLEKLPEKFRESAYRLIKDIWKREYILVRIFDYRGRGHDYKFKVHGFGKYLDKIWPCFERKSPDDRLRDREFFSP